MPTKLRLTLFPPAIQAIIRKAKPDISETFEIIRRADVGETPPPDTATRSRVFYLSTRNVASDCGILVPSGVDLSAAQVNCPLLEFHKLSEPAIGSWDQFAVDDYGVKARATFATTERAEEFWTLYGEGHMKAVSVDALPLETIRKGDPKFVETANRFRSMWKDDRVMGADWICVRWLLLEGSVCNLGVDSAALMVETEKRGRVLSEAITRGLGITDSYRAFREALRQIPPLEVHRKVSLPPPVDEEEEIEIPLVNDLVLTNVIPSPTLRANRVVPPTPKGLIARRIVSPANRISFEIEDRVARSLGRV